MNAPFANVRCFKHVSREAAAKCPDCGRFYCRECVTEHEGRVVCRSCLEHLLVSNTPERSGLMRMLGGWMLACLGYVLTVYAFYLLGRILLKIPSAFHAGTYFD